VEGRLCALRVEVNGATGAADGLVAERDSWETQLRADLAGAADRVWLEKIVLRTTRPGAGSASSSEAVAAIDQAIDALYEDPAGLADLARVFDPLRTKLGADQASLRELDTTDLSPKGLASVLADVSALLQADLRET